MLFRAAKQSSLDLSILLKHLLPFPEESLDLVDHAGMDITQFAVDHWIGEGETEGVEECLRLFIEHPAVRRLLNTKNKDGDPLVISLLKQGRVDLVNVLLESSEIDLDVRDSAGKSLETIAR